MRRLKASRCYFRTMQWTRRCNPQIQCKLIEQISAHKESQSKSVSQASTYYGSTYSCEVNSLHPSPAPLSPLMQAAYAFIQGISAGIVLVAHYGRSPFDRVPVTPESLHLVNLRVG